MKKKTLKHHCCYPGKKVRLKIRDGTIIFGKFVDRRAPLMIIDIDGVHTKIHYKDIMQFQVWKRVEVGDQNKPPTDN